MPARVFLGFSALLWIPYGIACLLDPTILAEGAGVQATTPTGTTELRAMYGGLQIAIGGIALFGALRPDRATFALIALGAVVAGVGLARLAGALFDGAWTTYTTSALAFELVSVALVVWLLRRSETAPEGALP